MFTIRKDSICDGHVCMVEVDRRSRVGQPLDMHQPLPCQQSQQSRCMHKMEYMARKGSPAAGESPGLEFNERPHAVLLLVVDGVVLFIAKNIVF